MRRGSFLSALLTLLIAACSREPPPDPAIAVAVARLDAQQQVVETQVRQLRARQPENEPDFRGRTLSQDLEQWVMTPTTRDEIQALRSRALKSTYPADAQRLLDTAGSMLKEESERAASISKYWVGELPAPFWRRDWQSLFEANGVPADEPDGMLLDIENQMRKELDAGDFAAASELAGELVAVLAESRNRAATRIIRARSASLSYQPRKTACVGGAPAAGPNERARFVRGDSVDRFYPAMAIRRGEQGAVVMRARIDSSGCARSVAVVVHSGVPSLDDAALDWFETARFSPATRGGTPVDSELTWKVLFVIKS